MTKDALDPPLLRDWKETIDERCARDDKFEQALDQEWHSLTDAEIEKIDEIVDTQLLYCNFSITDYVHGFARAIEQALKEKNHD